jgi:MoaA/NifB/PqqE/SkfB family radical SAM enzyme
MSKYSPKEAIKAFSFKQVLKWLDKDPDTNAPKVVDWVAKFDRKGTVASQVATYKEAMADKDSNWWQLIRKVWNNYDAGVRKKFFENFIIYATTVGYDRRRDVGAKNDCMIPWAILLDPTSACNLRCKGCWATEYGYKLNLTLDEIDDIVNQGEEMGTFMYIYTGGEPMVRKDDLITICERHPNSYFLSFTNGTLIDQKFCDDMLRVKNFIPAISIEGFEESTDARRGEGTYQKIMNAMDLLTANRLPFGVSCCYTSQNIDTIATDEYIDFLIEKRALFAWFFAYMPVGKNYVKELLVPTEKREKFFHCVREWRKTKPIFTMDFMNDAEYVGGCIAGGRRYLHINANGDVEPCVFSHYSDSNIREKTLLEAYTSPMFQQYQKNIPFNDNMLRPCPILDNKDLLAKMVKEAGAKSTNLESPETADEYCERTHHIIDSWAPKAEELWTKRQEELKEIKAKREAALKK